MGARAVASDGGSRSSAPRVRAQRGGDRNAELRLRSQSPSGVTRTSSIQKGRNHMNTKSKGLAVITGASSGIGAIYADRLAHRGYDLLLVARDQKRMSELAAKLSLETGRKADILTSDLTDS